jgi:surface glycoprotein (TIGR04207 family)
MNSTGIWDKTRALFLAALMITSVFAGTITLSGAAVAQTDDTLLVDGDSNEGDFNTIQDAIDVANDNDTI